MAVLGARWRSTALNTHGLYSHIMSQPTTILTTSRDSANTVFIRIAPTQFFRENPTLVREYALSTPRP